MSTRRHRRKAQSFNGLRRAAYGRARAMVAAGAPHVIVLRCHRGGRARFDVLVARQRYRYQAESIEVTFDGMVLPAFGANIDLEHLDTLHTTSATCTLPITIDDASPLEELHEHLRRRVEARADTTLAEAARQAGFGPGERVKP